MGILKLNAPKGLIWIGALLALLAAPLHAQSDADLSLQENKIKAGLLYNFLKYTSWPDDGQAKENRHLQICLMGGDPFDGFLNPLEGRTAQQYTIRIATISTSESIDSCNLVFISQSLEGSLDGIMNRLRGHAVLTMSDINDFARHGGMVELSMQDDRRIHLYINQAAVSAANLHIGERLLKLAQRTARE